MVLKEGILPSETQNGRKEKKRDLPLEVVYAGTSPRRRAFLYYAFPNADKFTFPGGEEPDIEHVVDIMHGKLDTGLTRIRDLEKSKEKRFVAVVAADTRLNPLAERNGSTLIESRGKPKTLEEIRQIFEDMEEASILTNQLPYYQVQSGSGIHIKGPKTDQRIVELYTSTIELNLENVAYFATSEGIKEYAHRCAEFYSQTPYAYNGHNPPIEVTDIAAGLSLEGLVIQSAVVAIDGVPTPDERFRNTLRSALYNATVGISPVVLRPIKPDIDEFIINWDWLNQITDHGLQRS